MKIEDVVSSVLEEYERATKMFGTFNGAHEGYAVLLEELDELWDEVKGKHPDRQSRMKLEAVQVATMAVRFLTDVCE